MKKIKPREWDKDKSESKDDSVKAESKDGAVYESKTFRDRKAGVISADKKKKIDNDRKESSGKDDDQGEDSDKGYKKDKRDKFKESPRELKSKKYSDTRKERAKQTESYKSEKQSVINKIMSTDGKSKGLNHDDIKPFTQLPHVKTDDLTKLIEGMDKKAKLEDAEFKAQKDSKDSNDNVTETIIEVSTIRRNSLGSGEIQSKEESSLKRQKSLDDRSKSSDREGSEEKEKSESTDRRTERRIRNKV